MSLETTSTQAEGTQDATALGADFGTEAETHMETEGGEDPNDVSWIDEADDEDEAGLEAEGEGEEAEGGEEESEQSGTEEAGSSPPKDGEEERAATGEGDDKGEGDEKGEAKPPEGYVPHEALHQEREKRKQLAVEVNDLRATIAGLQAAGRKPGQDTRAGQPGKVAIPEDIREDVAAFSNAHPNLAEVVEQDTAEGRDLRNCIAEYGPDDPITASLAHSLSGKLEYQRAQQEVLERDARIAQARSDAFVDKCLDQMEEAVPGLFAEDSTAGEDLLASAGKAGFDPRVIAPLTDPRAVIAVPDGQGGQRKMLLGAGAVQVVKMLAKLTESQAGSADGVTTFSKEDVDKMVAEAVSDALKKSTTDKPGKQYRGLGSAPGAADVPEDVATLEDISEEEWGKLTPAQRKKLGLD